MPSRPTAAAATAAAAGRSGRRAAERSALCRSSTVLVRRSTGRSTPASDVGQNAHGATFSFLWPRPLYFTPAVRPARRLFPRGCVRRDHSDSLPTTEDLPPKARLAIRRASKQEPRILTQENASGSTEVWVDARPENNPTVVGHSNDCDDAATGDEFTLDWIDPPRTVLLVKKHDDDAAKVLIEIARHMKKEWPHVNIVVESSLGYLFQEIPFARFVPEEEKSELARIVDFVVAIGGDGTMLRVSGLFDKEVPPIMPFSLGRLGFLMPYDRRKYREAVARMMRGDVTILMRMRLACSLWSGSGKKILRDGRGMASINIMNEIVIHRGQSPHLAVVDVFVNSQLLTEAMGDGLIVATPTGSTAYSLSAGGPIVHPSLPAMVLTPICPQSLSFRPAIIPGRSRVQLRISTAARGPAQISFDGRQVSLLHAGETVEVGLSQYPVPCANRIDQNTDWVRDLNDMLKWNQSFVSGCSKKPLVQLGTSESAADDCEPEPEGPRPFGIRLMRDK